MKKADITTVLELAFVLVVSTAMFIYGFGKYIQFDNQSGVSKQISEMTGMELMWAFYGYSKTYALLLGVLEITGGVLLFFKKTRLLGALFLTGILLNVIAQDIFYGVNEGALRAAILYQIMLIGIIWINKNAFWAGIKALLLMANPVPERRRQWMILLAAVLVATLFKIIEFSLTH